MMHKAWCNVEKVPYNFSWSSIKFEGHTGWKIDDLNPVWVRLLGRWQLSNPSDLPCWQCSSHRIIMKFSGVITIDKSDVLAKGQGQRSRSQRSTQFNCFWTVTLVWIHILWWNDVQGLMWHRRCALLFFKVIRQISRSHRTKHSQFWPHSGMNGL